MAWLAAAAPYLKTAATVLSVTSSIKKGKEANAQSRMEAAQLRRRSNADRSIGQRDANEASRRGELATSRARAVAGASTGGADDPTVSSIVGDIEGRSEYNALASLYSGEDTAAGLDANALARRREGRAARRAGNLQAGATILSNADSLGDFFR